MPAKRKTHPYKFSIACETPEKLAAFIAFVGKRKQLEAALELTTDLAKLAKDGDCRKCLLDGYEPNPKCKLHAPYDLPNDTAVSEYHEAISTARELLGVPNA